MCQKSLAILCWWTFYFLFPTSLLIHWSSISYTEKIHSKNFMNLLFSLQRIRSPIIISCDKLSVSTTFLFAILFQKCFYGFSCSQFFLQVFHIKAPMSVLYLMDDFQGIWGRGGIHLIKQDRVLTVSILTGFDCNSFEKSRIYSY